MSRWHFIRIKKAPLRFVDSSKQEIQFQPITGLEIEFAIPNQITRISKSLSSSVKFFLGIFEYWRYARYIKQYIGIYYIIRKGTQVFRRTFNKLCHVFIFENIQYPSELDNQPIFSSIYTTWDKQDGCRYNYKMEGRGWDMHIFALETLFFWLICCVAMRKHLLQLV